jgi:hypothetical protein
MVADPWLGYVGGAEAVLAVLRDDECLHCLFTFIEIRLGPIERRVHSLRRWSE